MEGQATLDSDNRGQRQPHPTLTLLHLPGHAGPGVRQLFGDVLLLRHVAGELRRDLRARLAAGAGAAEHAGRPAAAARRQLLEGSTLWRLLTVTLL